MDQDRADYPEPESRGGAELRFDLSVIGWSLVLTFLAVLPGLAVAAAIFFGLVKSV
jgi:hypothetical protein